MNGSLRTENTGKWGDSKKTCHSEVWKCPLRTEFSFVQAESTRAEQNNKGLELLRCHFGTTQCDVMAAPTPQGAGVLHFRAVFLCRRLRL